MKILFQALGLVCLTVSSLLGAQSPIEQKWLAIWKAKEPLVALKAFQAKHGLFLETDAKVGADSILATEGPCGSTYFSLVPDAKNLTETVWEIDKKGKILRQWKPGTTKILAFNGSTLFREVELFEDPTDLDPYKEKRKSAKHVYKLGIGTDNSIEILPRDKVVSKWSVMELPCPSGLTLSSAFKYCVKEAKTERLFVLQRPCT